MEHAIKFHNQAIALEPLRTNSYSGMGYLLYLAGRYDEAQAARQKALDPVFLMSELAMMH
jgi:tetratricopeptide (TPR) repeat protein